MKKSTSLILLLLIVLAIKTTAQETPHFYLDENGVTIKCENCQPGDTGTVNGILYEAVDRELLDQRIAEEADLTVLCTSLVTEMDSLFYGMYSFNQDISSWDVSNVTDMSGMFLARQFPFPNPLYNTVFNQDIGNWDVSKVTNMREMFRQASNFNQDIGSWDVSNVTDMSFMFSGHWYYDGLTNAFNQDISSWDVSNVTDMSGMFCNSRFNQDIGSWDVNNVTDMRRMFRWAETFNHDIGEWDVGNVANMAEMFSGAHSFNDDIGSWNVSNVTDMSLMFYWAESFNQDIGDWNVSNVTDMSGMFQNDTSFNQDLSGWCVENFTVEPDGFATDCPLQAEYYPVWGEPCTPQFYLDENGVTIKCRYCQPGDTGTVNGILYEAMDRELLDQRISEDSAMSKLCTSLVTDMDSLFYGMLEFNQDIGSWDVSNVTDMNHMFMGLPGSGIDYPSHFNQDIGYWDVSNVTDMSWMFCLNRSFNQDIGDWDVSNVIDMNSMFWDAGSFNQDIGDWDVSNVTNMYCLLGFTSFNQDIGPWIVSNVTDMSFMFAYAKSFNQDIGDWDVSNVTDMTWMFNNAWAFNQDLSYWCVENISSEPNDFAKTCPLQAEYYPVWGTCPEPESIDEIEVSGLFSIYPNPTNSTFTLDLSAPIRGELEIHNLNGQLIHRRSIQSTSEQIEMTPYPNGIYFVTVRSDAWVRSEKVVKY